MAIVSFLNMAKALVSSLNEVYLTIDWDKIFIISVQGIHSTLTEVETYIGVH